MLAGILGAVTGLINTARHSGASTEPVKLAIIGTGESLNNVSLALVFAVLATLLVAIGALRLKSD